MVSKSDLSLLNSIHPVSRETLDRLETFVVLLRKWAAKTNLVAPSTLSDIWTRHVADSLQLYALSPGPLRWIDLGSGGGFPGVVTAILLAEIGGGWVDLVESNHKKAAFLRLALAETGARGTVHAVRIESAAETLREYACVSARALAELQSLLDMSAPWLCAGAVGWFHKGRDYRSEIEKARRSWRFDLVEHKSAIEEDSVILQIGNLQPITRDS